MSDYSKLLNRGPQKAFLASVQTTSTLQGNVTLALVKRLQTITNLLNANFAATKKLINSALPGRLG